MYLEAGHCALFDISYGNWGAVLVLAIEDAQEIFQLRTVFVMRMGGWMWTKPACFMQTMERGLKLKKGDR